MLLRIKRERNGGGRRNVPVAMWSWVRLQASWAKLVAKDPDRMEAVGDRSWQLKILDCCSRKMTSLGPRRAGVSLEAKKEMAEEHKKRSDISKKRVGMFCSAWGQDQVLQYSRNCGLHHQGQLATLKLKRGAE